MPAWELHKAARRRLVPSFLLFTILVLTLDFQSLWWDEGISLHLATSSFMEIVADRAANIHPPLYFFVLKGWVTLAGDTAFAARYLSALVTTLLPVLAYKFLSRRVGSSTGELAAWWLALSPPFIIYGQEVRAYAFLPLLWLALLAQVWPGRSSQESPVVTLETIVSETHFLGLSGSFAWGLRLALTQCLFIFIHYTGGIAAAWANLVWLVRLLLRSRALARAKAAPRVLRSAWYAWGLSIVCSVLLAVPWLGTLLQTGALGLKQQAGLSNVLDKAVPGDYVLKLLGIFHTVGLPDALADPLLSTGSVVVVFLLLAVTLWHLVAHISNHRVFSSREALLLVWLLPFTVVPLLWLLSPQAHPRYILPFILGLVLFGSAMATDTGVPKYLRGVFVVAVFLLNLLGLHSYLFESSYARSDVRGVAAWLRHNAQPGAVVLIPHTDWSLPQYDLGAVTWVMLPPSSDTAGIAATLSQVTHENQTVYALDYRRGALDQRGQVETTLSTGGHFVAEHSYQGVLLREYKLLWQPKLPVLREIPRACVADSSLCLTATGIYTQPISGAGLPVILKWEGTSPVARYAVSLRLYASSGALIATQDALLLDAVLRPTGLWTGDPVTTYHTIPLPVGLVPSAYRLEVSVYDVAAPEEPVTLHSEASPPVPSLVVGEVVPRFAPWVEPSPYGVSPGPDGPRSELSRGLLLEGAALDRGVAYPGQTVFSTLRWRVSGALPGSLPHLVLRQPTATLALSQTSSLSVTGTVFPVGRPLLEHIAFKIPVEVQEGIAEIVLESGIHQVVVGELELEVGAHTFTLPDLPYSTDAKLGDVAILPGFDFVSASEVHSGDSLHLILAWRAGTGTEGTDFTVFVHLLDTQGNIIAQNDSKPVNGTRLTGGWLPGEILLDEHLLEIPVSYAGPATLRVGMYNAASGMRLPWSSGDDALTLPLTLTVTSPF